MSSLSHSDVGSKRKATIGIKLSRVDDNCDVGYLVVGFDFGVL